MLPQGIRHDFNLEKQNNNNNNAMGFNSVNKNIEDGQQNQHGGQEAAGDGRDQSFNNDSLVSSSLFMSSSPPTRKPSLGQTSAATMSSDRLNHKMLTLSSSSAAAK